MSIEKDCCFMFFYLSLIFYLFIRCNYLKNRIKMQKKCFADILKHDLRVPLLAQIRGLDLIKYRSDIDVKMLTEEIGNSCKYTLEMVEMLADTYKMENHEIMPNIEMLNFTDIISCLFDEYRYSASEKNIRLKTAVQYDVIYADKAKLYKMLKLLVSASIQHSRPNTHLEISLKNSFNKYVIRISYSGYPVINGEDYEKSLYTAVGQGISMYLCKKIIESHGGKISFKSLHDNNLFEISLPKPVLMFKGLFIKYSSVQSALQNLI